MPTVTSNDIDECLDILACLIDSGEVQYIALFERLEREQKALHASTSIHSRIASRASRARGIPEADHRTAVRRASAA